MPLGTEEDELAGGGDDAALDRPVAPREHRVLAGSQRPHGRSFGADGSITDIRLYPDDTAALNEFFS